MQLSCIRSALVLPFTTRPNLSVRRRLLRLAVAAMAASGPSWTGVARAQLAAVSPPELLHHDEAAFPSGAPDEGTVVLEVVIEESGTVGSVRVATTGGRAFDEAATRAMWTWRFRPATRSGKPVPAKIRVPFHFQRPQVRPVESAPVHAKAPTPADVASEPPPTRTVSDPAPVEVRIAGRSVMPSRGASDYDVAIGKLAAVPRADAASLLRLAPGVLLTNEGGTGHPYQIFLRGFDAREGQDIEFTVDGIPMNEVGNVHGNGLVDTHFIVPELVQSLRVIEGPYAPQQGNFAVAGSAAYDVGLRDEGFSAKTTFGSFGTKRLLLTFRPHGTSEHTFGAAELFSSDGFGQNRQSERASAMGGYEAKIGEHGSLRLLAQSYVTHYGQAGLLRQDDLLAGRKDFYDTYDTEQGGDSSRHSIGATYKTRLGSTRFAQSAFVAIRDFRLRENFTGFLNDPQRQWQTPHVQRGDLIDQRSQGVMVGGRGSGRHTFSWLGRNQEVEVGYFARHDVIDGQQQRNRLGTTVPYRTELDLESALTNVALYSDASITPLPYVTVRGGARADLFHYRVHNKCALTSQTSFGGDQPNTECFTSDRLGYRSADQTTTTSAGVLQPRATVILGPFQGFSFSASRGSGARSIDPQYVDQNLKTPFAEVVSTEGGVAYQDSVGPLDLQVRSTFFSTSVDRDLFFNQTEGRNTLADGTTRTGFAGSVRATGTFFDLAANVTAVRATFDDTKLPIPYAPPFIARWDGVLFSRLPFTVFGERPEGTLGAGVSYVGRRPLPFDERSDIQFVVDAAAQLTVHWLTLAVTCTNLLDRRYRIGEYNYVSDFRSASYPTLVPARHFSAGEPRAVYASLTVTFGRDSRGSK